MEGGLNAECELQHPEHMNSPSYVSGVLNSLVCHKIVDFFLHDSNLSALLTNIFEFGFDFLDI